MKKILLPLFATAMLFAACENDQDVALELTQQKGVTFIVPDFQNADGTRMAVDIDASGATFTWTAGDTIGVFPANGYQTAFPISSGAGTNTAYFDGADWALRPSASYAAYYPFVYEIKDKTAIEASYLGQTQDGNGSTAHIGAYDYLAAKYNTVSASGDVNFTLNHLGCLVRFQLTMPEADTYTNMTLSCEGSMLTTAGKFDLTAATPTLVANSQDASISLALNNVATTEANQVLTLYMMLPPMDLSGKNLSIKVSGETDYEATVAGKDMKAGSIYGYSNSMTQLHEYVDLGLPSGTMWATCNIGANAPEEAGGYYAFGEVETKSNYTWETYKWCNGDYNKLTKYCIFKENGTVDNKIVLEATDDAAHVNWGGSWRMPTYVEAKELYTLCTKTACQRNGVAGYLLTGPNGNSIFMPQVGFVRETNLLDGCLYMSSGLCMETAMGGRLSPYFILPKSSMKSIGQDWRRAGFPVRAVCRPNEIKATSFSLNQTTLTLTVGGPSESLSAQILPSNASCNKVYWYSSDAGIASVSETGVVTAKGEGSCYITAITMDGTNLNASCEVSVEAPVLMHNGHEYVDLGLSVKWATCNVGANKPEEYGNYIPWAMTTGYDEGQRGFGWSTYKYGSDWNKMRKYCVNSYYGSVDGNKELLSIDDAASVIWGGSWRMPTETEMNELIDNCSWTWSSIDGVNGYLVLGKNGASIFLPAAGIRYNDTVPNTLHYENSQGSYWTKNLSLSTNSCGVSLKFTVSSCSTPQNARCLGLSVRPVCE